ncbi:hypothetical protein D4R42_04215 [bacterium]|nr:MAG: hypothetical protein D4R42_04215 [bacterium]
MVACPGETPSVHVDHCDTNPGHSDASHVDSCFDFDNYADAWQDCAGHSDASPELCPGAFQGNFHVDNTACHSNTAHDDWNDVGNPHSDSYSDWTDTGSPHSDTHGDWTDGGDPHSDTHGNWTHHSNAAPHDDCTEHTNDYYDGFGFCNHGCYPWENVAGIGAAECPGYVYCLGEEDYYIYCYATHTNTGGYSYYLSPHSDSYGDWTDGGDPHSDTHGDWGDFSDHTNTYSDWDDFSDYDDVIHVDFCNHIDHNAG